MGKEHFNTRHFDFKRKMCFRLLLFFFLITSFTSFQVPKVTNLRHLRLPGVETRRGKQAKKVEIWQRNGLNRRVDRPAGRTRVGLL